jgi:hypothetical protein
MWEIRLGDTLIISSVPCRGDSLIRDEIMKRGKKLLVAGQSRAGRRGRRDKREKRERSEMHMERGTRLTSHAK